jgi:ribosomal-protein-alanine N-acetyltransferase
MVGTIQLMQLSDLKYVLKIEEQSFSTSWTFNAFIYELLVNEKATYYTFKVENQIIGYIGYWLLDDDIHITNLAVAPIFRKKGIASQLINFIVRKAKNIGVSQVSLEVRISNQEAIKLYEKIGFDKGKLLKKYYKREDGIEMVLLLKGGKNEEKEF